MCASLETYTTSPWRLPRGFSRANIKGEANSRGSTCSSGAFFPAHRFTTWPNLNTPCLDTKRGKYTPGTGAVSGRLKRVVSEGVADAAVYRHKLPYTRFPES